MSDPLYRYSRSALSINVYPDRIVIERGVLWSKQRDVIPLRSVASVSSVGLNRHSIVIADASGKQHKHVTGRDTDALVEAIAMARSELP